MARRNYPRTSEQRARRRDVDRARRRRTERRQHAAEEKARRQAAFGQRPDLTAARAADFVKLLASGVPGVEALRYIQPKHYTQCDERMLSQWLHDWSNSELVLTAISELNGGEWQELDPDRRLQLAFDKHLAELAFILYTNNYRTADESLVKRMDKAREALQAHLDQHGENQGSAWDGFVREFMDKTRAELPGALPITPPAAGKAN